MWLVASIQHEPFTRNARAVTNHRQFQRHSFRPWALVRCAQQGWLAERAYGLIVPQSCPTSPHKESSIVEEFMGGNNSCCRMHESDVWWKAPKGLPTNVLCDNCGLSWRKYADLNVRPIREDPLSKAKTGDKREGTPVNGAPSAKRAKVSTFLYLIRLHN